jgi:GGDEF domain-containing protein
VPLFKDEETQVYSERYLNIRVEEEYLHARKTGTRLSALLIALEEEERRRPAAAPAVEPPVVRLAGAIRHCAPHGVFIARHGKEAIALLVPGAGGTRSRALAKVLGQRVEERLAKAAKKPVKIRVGTARLEKTDGSGSEMLARAGAAMRRWDE